MKRKIIIRLSRLRRRLDGRHHGLPKEDACVALHEPYRTVMFRSATGATNPGPYRLGG